MAKCMAMWCRIVLSLYAGRLFLATDKTQQHNGTPAPVQMGTMGGGRHIYSCYLGERPKEMDE